LGITYRPRGDRKIIQKNGIFIQKRKHKLITCKCDFCDKEFLLSEVRALNQKVHFCNKICFKQGAKKGGKFNELLCKTNLEKYGVENCSQRNEISLNYCFPTRWLFEDFSEEFTEGLKKHLTLKEKEKSQKENKILERNKIKKSILNKLTKEEIEFLGIKAKHFDQEK
jgi:hypothetical protein